MIHTERIATSDGQFTAVFSDRGLIALSFPSTRETPAPPVTREAAPSVPAELECWVRMTANALQAVLEGRKPALLPPLDWRGSTEFQRKVWAALLRIELGQTWTYAELAREVGHPNAFRAAGGACGANPIPVLVPCHRVLAANQRIGGFSGGLDWKRRLLAREGVRVAEADEQTLLRFSTGDLTVTSSTL